MSHWLSYINSYMDMSDYVARFERQFQSDSTLVNWHFILKSKVNIGMTWAEFKTRWWRLKNRSNFPPSPSSHLFTVVCVRSLSQCLHSHRFWFRPDCGWECKHQMWNGWRKVHKNHCNLDQVKIASGYEGQLQCAERNGTKNKPYNLCTV